MSSKAELNKHIQALENEVGDIRVTSRFYHDLFKKADAQVEALKMRWRNVWYRRLWRWIRRED